MSKVSKFGLTALALAGAVAAYKKFGEPHSTRDQADNGQRVRQEDSRRADHGHTRPEASPGEDTANDDIVADSPRDEQHDERGQSVVEEWGEESFPASDPPQSW